jgi:hypothetical protein
MVEWQACPLAKNRMCAADGANTLLTVQCRAGPRPTWPTSVTVPRQGTPIHAANAGRPNLTPAYSAKVLRTALLDKVMQPKF